MVTDDDAMREASNLLQTERGEGGQKGTQRETDRSREAESTRKSREEEADNRKKETERKRERQESHVA